MKPALAPLVLIHPACQWLTLQGRCCVLQAPSQQHTTSPQAGWLALLFLIHPIIPSVHCRHFMGGVVLCTSPAGSQKITPSIGMPRHHRSDAQHAGPFLTAPPHRVRLANENHTHLANKLSWATGWLTTMRSTHIPLPKQGCCSHQHWAGEHSTGQVSTSHACPPQLPPCCRPADASRRGLLLPWWW